MRRLYVTERFRGLGIGRALAEAVIEHGHAFGYKSMRLKSNQVLTEATRLYVSLGFREIAPCERIPIEGMVAMELELT
jgi:GNAT superfamily N-acetyltransferase